MKASPSDQKSILDIQRFDQESATLNNKAAKLPEIGEIASTIIKQNNARDLRIAAQTELKLFGDANGIHFWPKIAKAHLLIL